MRVKTKKDRRRRIALRQRTPLKGTSARPRLAVFRSASHISAQVIDDATGTTMASASSVEPSVRAGFAEGVRGGNKGGAQAVGKLVAERALEKGITSVVFDRGGFLYHGRVRSVADAARGAGLKF
jgi:large subunit ribosomal protein L18